MKAKDFKELDFSPWETDFTEDAFDEGEDCLRLTIGDDENEITVFIRDEGENLVIEWSSENGGEVVQIVTPADNKTVDEVYDIICEHLESQVG